MISGAKRMYPRETILQKVITKTLIARAIITKAIYQIKEIPIFKIFAVHPLIRSIAKTI
jgi:hypothetical protein